MNIQPFLVLLILSGILLLVAGTWALVRRRRKRRQTKSGSALVKRCAEACRHESPLFQRLLENLIYRHQAERIVQNREALKALSVIEEMGKKKKSTIVSGSLLQLSTVSRLPEKKILAAMTTVLRTIYFDDEIRRNLPADLDEELDRYLDCLTEN